MRSIHMWLLIIAAYGLIQAKHKWPSQSDEYFLNFELIQCKQSQQLFFLRQYEKIVLEVERIVDEIKEAKTDNNLKEFIKLFCVKFKFWSASNGPRRLRIFEITMLQEKNFAISTSADNKRNSVMKCKLSIPRYKQFNKTLICIKRAFYLYKKSLLCKTEAAIGSLCLFHASYLQQKALDFCGSHLV